MTSTISFTFETREDIENALGVLAALGDALELLEGSLVATRPGAAGTPAAPKRGRPLRSKNKTTTPETVVEPASNGAISEPVVAAAPNGHVQLELISTTEEVIEVARDRLRSIAQDFGVVWLRPKLEQYGVRKMSELTDAQVREFLRDSA